MTARDADVTQVEHGLEKQILAGLGGQGLSIEADAPGFVKVADLNGDGARDLITTGIDTIEVDSFDSA